jgi:plastocyanin
MNVMVNRFVRQPLSPLGRLTAATLVTTAMIFAAIQFIVLKGGGPPFVPFIVILMLGAAVMATGWRWTSLIATVLLGLLTIGVIAPTMSMILQEISTPGMPMGPLLLLLLPTMVIGTITGVVTTVQNYRQTPTNRHLPRWLTLVLCTIIGLALGASGLHVIAAAPEGTEVAHKILASLPSLVTKDFAFDQQEIRVKAGELVALRLTNADQMPHSFDVDEFDVHVLMPPSQDALALFIPTEPGTNTFYCAPHYNKATGEGMKGTLIVEP